MPTTSRYDIEAIRQQVRSKMKKDKDPNEFRPPKAEEGKTYKFRFYILPPLQKGDTICDGKVTCANSMELFAISAGTHYLDNKRIGCPRVINDADCEICQYGFDLMAEIDGSTDVGKKKRGVIARQLLASQYHVVNIYFPVIDVNPEELRGKVMWLSAPKTVVDIWLECLYRDDDGGDQEEPLPFGVFYDEMNAYLFQLEVIKDGQMNSYKKSKFLVTTVLGARPIATDKERKPDLKKIKSILEKRYDLFAKIPVVDPDVVRQVAASLAGQAKPAGDEEKGSGGFDHDEEAVQKGKVATTKPAIAKPAIAKPAIAKAATTTAKKPELEPLVEEAVADELSGEEPVEENAESAEPEVEEQADVDAEVDRLLGELDG